MAQDRCPPEQVVDHGLSRDVELGGARLDVAALKMRSQCLNGDVYGGAQWRHLKRDNDLPQLLDGPDTTG